MLKITKKTSIHCFVKELDKMASFCDAQETELLYELRKYEFDYCPKPWKSYYLYFCRTANRKFYATPNNNDLRAFRRKKAHREKLAATQRFIRLSRDISAAALFSLFIVFIIFSLC